jgi:hypothetical protein
MGLRLEDLLYIFQLCIIFLDLPLHGYFDGKYSSFEAYSVDIKITTSFQIEIK